MKGAMRNRRRSFGHKKHKETQKSEGKSDETASAVPLRGEGVGNILHLRGV